MNGNNGARVAPSTVGLSLDRRRDAARSEHDVNVPSAMLVYMFLMA